MLFHEYASDVNRRHGFMLPVEEVMQRTGFRSVYAFSEEDALLIKSRESSKGLNQFEVYSDRLVLDIDTGDIKDVENIEKFCNDRDLTYSVFFSGSKGYHVEIPTKPKASIHLPITHKILADRISAVVDKSIFRHGSLYRLPGTIHKKTGNPKVLLNSVEGLCVLDFDIKTPEPTKFNPVEIEPEEDIKWALARAGGLFGQEPGLGNRHACFWKTAKSLFDAGFSDEFVEELLLKINESWANPKEENEVIRAIRGAR